MLRFSLLPRLSVRRLAVTVGRYVVFFPRVVMLRINYRLQLCFVLSWYRSFINLFTKRPVEESDANMSLWEECVRSTYTR